MCGFTIPESISNDKRPAINHGSGPLMVIAGPGTGKTMMIVWRVLKLILEDNINPERIWVTTFTNKAATELKIKISSALKDLDSEITISNMLIGTIHSTCLQLIEENPEVFYDFKKPITILDEYRQLLFFYKHYKELGVPDVYSIRNQRPPLEDIINIMQHINWLQLFQVDPEDYKKEISKKLNQKVVGVSNKDFHIAETYEKYQEILGKEIFIDFPTILSAFFRKLLDNEEFRKYLADRFDFILIDEYQDINPIQQEIFFFIIDEMEEKNINIVGDDDQTIYQFRGAGTENLKEFQKKFGIGDDRIFKLKTNYRSPPSIINRYNSLILDPTITLDRFLKDIKPNNKRKKPDYGIIKFSSNVLYESIEDLAVFIKKLKVDNQINKYGDVAILLRSIKRNHLEDFEFYLGAKGIPFTIVGKSGLFSTNIGNQLLLYFGIIKNRTFRLTTDFVEKSTYLSFSDEFVSKIKLNGNRSNFIDEFLNKTEPSFANDQKLVKKLRDIHKSCSNQKLSTLGAFYSFIRLVKFFSRDIKDKYYNEVNQLAKISNIILDFEEFYTPYSFIAFHDFINTLWYNDFAELPEGDFRDPKTVKIMTVHQAKGLEFPIVIIGEAIKKRFPVSERAPEFYKNIDCAKLKIPKRNHRVEELKLFYVASSRPRDLLIINTAKKISVKDNRKNAETDWIKNIPRSTDSDFKKLYKKVEEYNPIGHDFEYKEEGEVFSFSRLDYYKTCPFRYLIVRNFNFSFPIEEYFTLGTNIHAALEDINRRIMKNIDVSKEDDDIEEIIGNNWIDLQKSSEDNQSLIRNYIKPIKNYIVNELPNIHEIYGAEEVLWINIDDKNILTGVIDLVIRNEDGSLKITDFKLGAERSRDSEEAKEKYKKQLGTYIYLFHKANGTFVKNASLYLVKDGKELDFVFTQEEIDDIEKELKVIIDNITNEVFTASPNENKCKDCELHKFKVCPYV